MIVNQNEATLLLVALHFVFLYASRTTIVVMNDHSVQFQTIQKKYQTIVRKGKTLSLGRDLLKPHLIPTNSNNSTAITMLPLTLIDVGLANAGSAFSTISSII